MPSSPHASAATDCSWKPLEGRSEDGLSAERLLINFEDLLHFSSTSAISALILETWAIKLAYSSLNSMIFFSMSATDSCCLLTSSGGSDCSTEGALEGASLHTLRTSEGKASSAGRFQVIPASSPGYPTWSRPTGTDS